MAGESLMPDLPLFEEEAEDALTVFDNLRLSDVIGTPTCEEAVGQWFREIVVAILGSRDPETDIRYVQELFAMLPKGSAKTTYGGLLMLTALILNRRPRARFFLIAPTQSTADIAFDAVKGAIELDPELNNQFWVRDNKQLIVDRVSKAELAIKTFSLDVLNGPKPVGVLLDEVHLIADRPKAAQVMRQIRGGLQKNTESFFLMTTTQSNEEPKGVFLQELTVARNTRDGKMQGRMLPILYEFPNAIATDEQQWSNPEIWHCVMPNLGRGTRLETYMKEWNVERAKGEEARRLWASQHLNIQIGLGMKGDGWVGGHFWEGKRQVDETLRGEEGLEELLARSEVVVVGIDGGGLDDFLGLCVMGREKVTRRWLIWNRAWVHKIVPEERRQDIATKIETIAKEGDLIILDNESDADVQEVADIICQVRERGLLPEEKSIGCDAVGTSDIADELVKRKFTVTTEETMGHIIAIGQGYRLMSAIDTLGRRVAQGKLLHGGSALMRWVVGNAKTEKRGNSKMVTKQASESAKIDPLMATFNAAHLMALSPTIERSVYEDRGIMVI